MSDFAEKEILEEKVNADDEDDNAPVPVSKFIQIIRIYYFYKYKLYIKY